MASQVVLITGASSGFGKACAEHLGGIGHCVYGTSRGAAFPAAAAAEPSPTMIPMDVRDDASVRAAVDFVVEREGRLDVVVNNAGGEPSTASQTDIRSGCAVFPSLEPLDSSTKFP